MFWKDPCLQGVVPRGLLFLSAWVEATALALGVEGSRAQLWNCTSFRGRHPAPVAGARVSSWALCWRRVVPRGSPGPGHPLLLTSPPHIGFQENERTKDLVIEQRFHRTIIGQKGERIREIRDKFPEVRVSQRRLESSRRE